MRLRKGILQDNTLQVSSTLTLDGSKSGVRRVANVPPNVVFAQRLSGHCLMCTSAMEEKMIVGASDHPSFPLNEKGFDLEGIFAFNSRSVAFCREDSLRVRKSHGVWASWICFGTKAGYASSNPLLMMLRSVALRQKRTPETQLSRCLRQQEGSILV